MGASRFRQIRILQSHSSAPPRTYLLAAQSDQRQHLAGCRCAEESGDGVRIVRRVDLHYVASDDLQPGQAPQEPQGLPAGEATDLWGAGTRGEGWVHEVHVEGDVGPC